MKIDFVGLGRMGLPMAERLQASGHRVSGWDIDPVANQRAAEAGVTVASTLSDIGVQCDVVFLCLPGPEECAAVIDGPVGLLARIAPNSLVIDTSTNGQADAKRWAAVFAAQKQAAYLDAPITGGTVGAVAGTLTIFVGGEASAFDQARPLLQALGSRVEHVGSSGTGVAIKLINQSIYLTYCVTLAQTVASAKAAGIDPAGLLDLLRTSVAGDPLSTNWYQCLAAEDRAPGFSIERAAKDIELFREMVAETGEADPLSDTLFGMLERGITAGIGDLDIAALADRGGSDRE